MTYVFELIARMASAVVAPTPVHLDSLLAFVLFSRSSIVPPTRETPLEQLRDCELPLARVETRGARITMCTSMLVGGAARSLTYQTRRRDAEDVDRLARSFCPSMGPGRERLRRIPLVEASEVRFRGVGDVAEVASIVRHVRHLGKERGAGHGRVLEWSWRTVDDVDPAQVLLDGQGAALRHLPLEWCRETDGRTGLAAVEQPYWHPGRQRAAVLVGTKVELHEDVLQAVRSCR